MKAQKSNKTPQPAAKSAKNIKIREASAIRELAEIINLKAKDLLEKLTRRGKTVTVNSNVTQDLAEAISRITGIGIEIVPLEEYSRQKAEADEKKLQVRPPIVTIMGHVDHGKTTLLDAIRESNIVDKESGGITQHIGAYRVIHNGHPITFVDTPGHEAFTRMRARGAHSTDIVILVVAADDGVMPQTREAINHAKAADVPIIVAINKIDTDGADLDKVKQQLSKEGLLIEEWGGDTVSIDISAKEKTNIAELLEMILLVSEVTEIKGNPEAQAQGVVLEARLDAHKGPVATVIILHGCLKPGDAFVSGTAYGKARALFDEKGKPIREAGLSVPVEVLGFSDVPTAGDYLQVVEDPEAAKRIALYRADAGRLEETPIRKEHMTLDQLFKSIEGGESKELALIIKADVLGSVEVLKDLLPNLSTDKVTVKILHAATGKISESDIVLATASNAIVLGYNTRPNSAIQDLAKKENVEIRTYRVIYELIDDIKRAMIGMLDPEIREIHQGRAEIRRLFRIPRTGIIAGCLVVEGKITRNSKIRILRDDRILHEGKIGSLKHLKNNVTEVKKDYECGIGIENFRDIREGDVIEAFTTEKVMPE